MLLDPLRYIDRPPDGAQAKLNASNAPADQKHTYLFLTYIPAAIADYRQGFRVNNVRSKDFAASHTSSETQDEPAKPEQDRRNQGRILGLHPYS